MTTEQIVLAAVLGIVLLISGRRAFLLRSVKRRAAHEADGMLRSGAVLLDVRTDSERQRGHIRGSLHIPLHALAAREGELERYKGREIICYCQSGTRSLTAAARLSRSGHSASSMDGGIAEWNLRETRQ